VQSVVLCYSLDVVNRCVRCVKGHPFCVECVGDYSLKKNFPGVNKLFSDSKERRLLTGADPNLMRYVSDLRGPLRRMACGLKGNACPVCMEVGPYHPDQSIDVSVAALQVWSKI